MVGHAELKILVDGLDARDNGRIYLFGGVQVASENDAPKNDGKAGGFTGLIQVIQPIDGG